MVFASTGGRRVFRTSPKSPTFTSPSAVSSRWSDTIATTQPSTTTSDPSTSTSPEATTYVTLPGLSIDPPEVVLTSFGRYPDGAVVQFPAEVHDDEAAVHALAPTHDGWLAVGSVTQQPEVGVAAVWSVAPDGTFGEPAPLPRVDARPGIARDVVTTSDGPVVVGIAGAGRDAQAMVWTQPADGSWAVAALPTEPGSVHGSIADRVLILSDGTIVVVGRGDGPPQTGWAVSL